MSGLSQKSLLSDFVFGFLILTYCAGCSNDNATLLASELKHASEKLDDEKEGSEYTIHFRSMNAENPYTILIFPKRGATAADLISKGLDSAFVKDLYPQLSYIDLKEGATLIVYQQSRISFTTYYRRFVDVSELQIVTATGDKDIVVKKIGMGPGAFTPEVVMIVLHP